MIDVAGFGTLPDSIVVLRAQGQSYTCCEQRASLNVVDDLSADVAFVLLDKGYFPEGDACDYSASDQTEDPKGFLLELKGRDVKHAVEQLKRTLDKLFQRGVSVGYRQAAVVSSGASKPPSATWERLQKLFRRQTGVKLVRYQNRSSVPFLKAAA